MPSGVIATLLHAKAAVITARTSRIAVLPTVPFRVIAPPAARETTVPLPRSRKVESFRAGLPLRLGCVLARMWLSRTRYEDKGQKVSKPLQGARSRGAEPDRTRAGEGKGVSVGVAFGGRR